jgi:hypothetical protein
MSPRFSTAAKPRACFPPLDAPATSTTHTTASASPRSPRGAGERIARRRDEEERKRGRIRSQHEYERTGAVRLLASSASERAYAYDNQSMLLFTDILVTVLDEHALIDGLSWEQIIREVRARVQQFRPEQRPGVEGNRDRRPFTTQTVATPIDHFHVQREGQRLRLAAGTVAGLRPEDGFELVPYTSHDGPAPGTARIRSLGPFHAILEQPRGAPEPPIVMFARRLGAPTLELAARLATADLAAAHQLQATMGGHRLRPPMLADTPAGYIDLLDEQNPDAAPDFRPQLIARLPLADPNTPDELVRALRRLERWAGLAAQLADPGLGPLAGCFTLTYGPPRRRYRHPTAPRRAPETRRTPRPTPPQRGPPERHPPPSLSCARRPLHRRLARCRRRPCRDSP